MRIAIIKMTLKNFQIHKHLVIEATGRNVNIYGDNKVGKTTIFNSFTWVIFGKDSENKNDFDIQPIDPVTEEVIHGLETEVEIVFDMDGKQLSLRKVYYEKWTKKRGAEGKEMTGHTTDYFVDGVPRSKGEYDSTIRDMFDENAFKLLTNPLYFNEQFKVGKKSDWQSRRDLIMLVCGNISDAEVFDSSSKLSGLPAILGSRTIDDHRKVIAARKTQINGELEKIPARITEASRIIPDITGLDFTSIEKQINDLRGQQDIRRQTITRIQNGGDIAENKRKLAEIDAELLRMKNEHSTKEQAALKELRSKVNAADDNYRKITGEVNNYSIVMNALNRDIQDMDNRLHILREEWEAINTETFQCDAMETACPYCKQEIPEEFRQEAVSKLEADFNRSKSTRRETNKSTGMALKEQQTAKQNNYQEVKNLYETALKQQEAAKKALDTANNALNTATSPNLDGNMFYKVKVQERAVIADRINLTDEGNQDDITKLRAEISQLDTNIRNLETDLAKKEQIEKAKARVDELKVEEKKLAQELSKLDSELYLTDEFIRTKVSMLESKINSRFRIARFVMFRKNITNDGIEECCDMTIDGVSYWTLNHGSRVNGGIDIINVLSEHYGFTAPIFEDNAESVTKLEPTKAQLIRLVVSETDQKLRVEVV